MIGSHVAAGMIGSHVAAGMIGSHVARDGFVLIRAESVIDAVVERFPAVAGVFIRRRMHCLGCDVAPFHTIADAAREYGQALDELLSELNAAAGLREPLLATAAEVHSLRVAEAPELTIEERPAAATAVKPDTGRLDTRGEGERAC